MWANPNLTRTRPSPVVEAKRWIAGKEFEFDRPLINVSQAAPTDPPPEGLRHAIANLSVNLPAAHLYGPVLGLPELRVEVARQFSDHYDGALTSDNVAITQGCNQAFTAAMSSLAGPGDEVILPSPWYFNHQMWLDMAGVTTVPLATGIDMIPDVETARALITPRTRAIVLVTPNNPAGVEYPGTLVEAFFDLAKERGIALVLDETYRDFHSQTGAPHPLFARPDWGDTLIQLYSFSKAYRLTGHRVGALIAAPQRLLEVEKYLDTVAICPNQLAQHAALWGMKNLGDWLAGERAEILARRALIEDGFAKLDGWTLRTAGAYFAYVEHPFDEPSDALCRRMVDDIAILALPGTMFTPEGDPDGARQIRIAFANIDASGIAQLFARLAELK